MSKRRRQSEEYELTDYPELNKRDRKIYNDVKDQIKAEEPTILSVLTVPLLPEDKLNLFRLYEVYHHIPDDTSMEKYETRKEFIQELEHAQKRYKDYHRYSENEHKEIDELNKIIINNDIEYTIVKLPTNLKNRQVIYGEYKRMLSLSSHDDEKSKLQTWLKWATSLPYDRKSISHIFDLQYVHKRLNEELYGMNKVKEQILIFLNTKQTNPDAENLSLGLLGPPGCGKTTIVRLLADILQYPLEQISLGGIQSADFLRGHSYTYIGGQPGEIVKKLCRMGVNDGILFFDEYDKVENEEMISTLLHITDKSQNNRFHDNYLSGIDIDLSHLWFVYSMNTRKKNNAKDDRVFYIELETYTEEDKFFIVRDYLLKKAQKSLNWAMNSIVFNDEVIRTLIKMYSPVEITSIRPLEDAVFSICRKINFLLTQQDKNGKLPFHCSFNLERKIKLPFRVDMNDLELLLD